MAEVTFCVHCNMASTSSSHWTWSLHQEKNLYSSWKEKVHVNIIIIITEMIFMVLSSMAKPLREFTRFIWWMQTQRRGGRQPSDQANRLLLRVCHKEMAATVHIHHRHFIITQPRSWYLFYRPTDGGSLSQPRHCSKGLQPMPKAAYHSCCREKHNGPQWDLNLHSSQACQLSDIQLSAVYILEIDIAIALCVFCCMVHIWI